MSMEKEDDVEAEIEHLRALDLTALQLSWRAMFGRAAASHLSKTLLLRLLAHRLQAQTFGDLLPATRKLLDGLATEAPGSDGDAAVPVPLPSQGQLMPGTVLIREHEGQQHHVVVAEGGFVWNGMTYESLSKIAFAITGTKWNGPRFFGLREKVPAP